MTFSVGLKFDGPHKSAIEPSGRIVSNYTRTLLYKTDSVTRPTEVQIVTDIGIVPGSPFPNDANATCQSVEIGPGPEPTRSPRLAYLIKVDWATNAPIPNTVSTDPTTMRTTWSLSATIQSRYIVRDRNGAMILNAAGQPFDGGIPVATRLGTAVAKKNKPNAANIPLGIPAYNRNNVLANSGKLNSLTFLGAAPGTLQVDIASEEHYEGGYHFWSETYTFQFDPLGWQPKPMNCGFFFRDGYDQLKRIVNADLGNSDNPTNEVQEPEPLMPDGSIVPVGSRPGLCNFVEVDAYPLLDFNTLGL